MSHPTPTLAERLAEGLKWHEAGKLAQAEQAYRQVLRESPDQAEASLQKVNGTEQLTRGAGFPVVELPDLDRDSGPFVDTAAVMRSLDLVVTSDTAIAHLAGALGVPVWVALSSDPDWRWMLDRADSPWYPSMRLFRQTRLGDWPSAVNPMATALSRMV